MLNITEKNSEELITLKHGKNIFHEALDKLIMDQRKNAKISGTVSYLGTLRTASYGSRIRMTALHTFAR